MTRWERLEEYLFDHDKDGSDFTVYDYAEASEEEVPEASLDIQGYLVAQRRLRSRTLYVLRRQPGTRTKNARWAVGVRTKDASKIGRALYDDTKARVHRAFMPDLIRVRTLNPRAARRVELQIDAVIDGALKVLEVAVQGGGDDDGVPV